MHKEGSYPMTVLHASRETKVLAGPSSVRTSLDNAMGEGFSDAAGSNDDARDSSYQLMQVQGALSRLLEDKPDVAPAQLLIQAKELAQDHLSDVRVRSLLLQIEGLSSDAELSGAWEELFLSCPSNAVIAHFYVRSLAKGGYNDDAQRVIDRFFPEDLAEADTCLHRATLLADARFDDASDELFRRLIDRHERRDIRVAFAKRLNKRGMPAAALETLAPVAHTFRLGTKAWELHERLKEMHALFCKLEPEGMPENSDVRILAMKHAILHFRERLPRDLSGSSRLSIALVTGSLSPGGAERQLTRIACVVNSALPKPAVSAVSYKQASASVEVIVRQYGEGKTQRNASFFLGDLVKANVRVTEINALPVVSARQQGGRGQVLRHLVEHLPPQVNYGVTRLCSYFRARKFDVVSLWQDGTCLQGALAAVLAGVPVIHLVFRGLPPNLRRDRYRPEYAVLYQAMAQVPGVKFVCNSKVVAQAYAQWLQLPAERFSLLYNGVPEMSVEPMAQDAATWHAFEQQTSDATETIGAVFRFEPDKRPLLWIRLAHRYVTKRPKARFVIVGEGRLMENARQLVAELGIGERFLFAGLSSRVGYWYSRMDVKVLLSRFEGLPNVLIEAQMLGVPVLATPAGGSAECFLEGETGELLRSVDQPDLDEACEKIARLVDACKADTGIRALAQRHAKGLFAVDAARDTFLNLCAAELAGRESPGGERNDSRRKVV